MITVRGNFVRTNQEGQPCFDVVFNGNTGGGVEFTQCNGAPISLTLDTLQTEGPYCVVKDSIVFYGDASAEFLKECGNTLNDCILVTFKCTDKLGGKVKYIPCGDTQFVLVNMAEGETITQCIVSGNAGFKGAISVSIFGPC